MLSFIGSFSDAPEQRVPWSVGSGWRWQLRLSCRPSGALTNRLPHRPSSPPRRPIRVGQMDLVPPSWSTLVGSLDSSPRAMSLGHLPLNPSYRKAVVPIFRESIEHSHHAGRRFSQAKTMGETREYLLLVDHRERELAHTQCFVLAWWYAQNKLKTLHRKCIVWIFMYNIWSDRLVGTWQSQSAGSAASQLVSFLLRLRSPEATSVHSLRTRMPCSHSAWKVSPHARE